MRLGPGHRRVQIFSVGPSTCGALSRMPAKYARLAEVGAGADAGAGVGACLR